MAELFVLFQLNSFAKCLHNSEILLSEVFPGICILYTEDSNSYTSTVVVVKALAENNPTSAASFCKIHWFEHSSFFPSLSDPLENYNFLSKLCFEFDENLFQLISFFSIKTKGKT